MPNPYKAGNKVKVWTSTDMDRTIDGEITVISAHTFEDGKTHIVIEVVTPGGYTYKQSINPSWIAEVIPSANVFDYYEPYTPAQLQSQAQITLTQDAAHHLHSTYWPMTATWVRTQYDNIRCYTQSGYMFMHLTQEDK